jgi:hypothetical protein
MREIFLAGEKAQESTPLLRDLIANRASQHGITRLQRIEHRALRDRTLDLELHFTADVRQGAKMLRKFDSNHGSLHRSFLDIKRLPVIALMNPDFAEDAV